MNNTPAVGITYKHAQYIPCFLFARFGAGRNFFSAHHMNTIIWFILLVSFLENIANKDTKKCGEWKLDSSNNPIVIERFISKNYISFYLWI